MHVSKMIAMTLGRKYKSKIQIGVSDNYVNLVIRSRSTMPWEFLCYIQINDNMITIAGQYPKPAMSFDVYDPNFLDGLVTEVDNLINIFENPKQRNTINSEINIAK